MSANSDVKLIHGAVVIDAWDLQLDSPDRRKNNSEYRRALVHDFDDGLTVNWDNDYPGGVKLNGVKAIRSPNTHIEVDGHLDCKGMLRLVGGGLNWTSFYTNDNNQLVIETQGAQSKGIVFKGSVGFERPVSLSKAYGSPARAVINIPDLVDEIVNLRNEIAQLKDRVAKLES